LNFISFFCYHFAWNPVHTRTYSSAKN
jgi:hypothetical protein